MTESLDAYNPTGAARGIEQFVVEDLSKWWVRRSRDRFPESAEFFRYILIETSKLLAPFVPFTADHIYKQVSNRSESVHLEDWPAMKNKFIKPELEVAMARVREIVALGLGLRKSANLKVRQPLTSLSIKEKIDPNLERYIMAEVNVKQILFAPSQEEAVTLDTTITPALKIEGYAREISRAIQEMRKDAGYKVSDKVIVSWKSNSNDVKKAMEILKIEPKNEKGAHDVEKEFELAPGAKLWLGITRQGR